MGGLLKSSILLLPAIMIAVSLFTLFGGEDFDGARSHPHADICQRDGDRLAQLQAKPSIDEAVRFGNELRCLKLWPQLLTVLDSLSQTAGSAGVSSPNAIAHDILASETAPLAAASPAMETTSATSDDARKHDEDRLAELQARPSVNDAMRFEGELAALERERDALAAEVGRLERRQASTSSGQPNLLASPQPALSAERSNLESRLALATLPNAMPARVLIRYLKNNPGARQRAESLANTLTRQGVEVADLRETAGAVRTELSFSYAPDEAIALRVGRLAGVTPVRRAQPKDGLMARPGTVELSLSGDGGLAVMTTSRKESNHE
jgi:hypothetical protein